MAKECITCCYCHRQGDQSQHKYVCENKDSLFYSTALDDRFDDWLACICAKYKESEEQ